MSVCALVLEAGGGEDQAIAALLHDAMEDQGGLPTLNTIKRLFGDRGENIVRECSDSESPDPHRARNSEICPQFMSKRNWAMFPVSSHNGPTSRIRLRS